MRAKTKIKARRWGRTALFCAFAVGCLYLASCAALGEWLAAPTAPGPDAPTNAEAVVSTGVMLAGSLNPFAGYAVGALGRLGLGAFMSRAG